MECFMCGELERKIRELDNLNTTNQNLEFRKNLANEYAGHRHKLFNENNHSCNGEKIPDLAEKYNQLIEEKIPY